jgi:hypothetical protein
MSFEILFDSTTPTTFFAPREWADLTGDSPVIDFGAPMAKFRVTVLLKEGTGERHFALQLADDAAFTQNVRTVGDHPLSLPTRPYLCTTLYAFRGPVRYAKLAMTGGAATYDARLEWTNAPMPGVMTVAPTLISLEPASAQLGSPNLTLRILGKRFSPQSVLVWNGTDDTAVYVSPTELTTTVNMATASVAVAVPVEVRNGTAKSNALNFEFVAAPTGPVLTSLAPASAPVGPGFSIQVFGSGFTPDSVLFVDGAMWPAVQTVYLNPTQLGLMTNTVSQPGTHTIQAAASPVGPKSNALTFSYTA